MQALTGKRILMLLENNPYPKDTRVRREALALVDAGYKVSVICQRAAGQRWYETAQGVQVYRYPAPPTGQGLRGYMLEYGYSLLAAFVLSLVVLIHQGFDVIHTHNPPDFFVMLAAGYQHFGKRFLYDHHDLAPDMYQALYGERANPWTYRILRFFERWSFRQADHLIATNASYRRVAMLRGGVPAERITIVRNGPNLEQTKTVASDAQLRASGKTIIGYVGDMGDHDGLDYLLRALNHLRQDLGRQDFYAVLIGTGNAWDNLKAQAAALGLTPEYVWFTGWLSEEELLRYLSSADICVDPDPYNSFTDRSSMIKMSEYMALGKPIVAFDLTEHRVTAQAAALYALPNNELDFAHKLAYLMDHPEMRQTMGAYGRQRVEAELSWQHAIPHLLQAYQRCCGAPAVDVVDQPIRAQP